MKKENFGDRVKELRRKSGMSMEELAKEVNTTKSSVNMWENAGVIPRESVLLELARTLNVSIDYLLGNKKVDIWGFHNVNNEQSLLEDKIIAVGWNEMGDLSKIEASREAYYKEYSKVYPDKSKQSVAVSAGQLFRFVNEAKVGDYVVYPTKFNRMINIGIIDSKYFFDDKVTEYKQKRIVKWLKSIPRSEFSQGALYEVGSFLSFFKVSHYADEFINAVYNKRNVINDQDGEENDIVTSETILEITKDYILKELNKNFKGYELENVVSDLLNAMGYRTTISAHGGDSGKDIIAYKDELPPRIIVQVKSQNGSVTETTVQSLKGAMDEGDYGLFVSLSDYTENAKKYLIKHPIIKSINGSELADLILKYYDNMPDTFKSVIKLKKAFIPIAESEQ